MKRIMIFLTDEEDEMENILTRIYDMYSKPSEVIKYLGTTDSEMKIITDQGEYIVKLNKSFTINPTCGCRCNKVYISKKYLKNHTEDEILNTYMPLTMCGHEDASRYPEFENDKIEWI